MHRKQQWGFRLEHTYHELGESRVDDPLFECSITAPPPVGVAEHGRMNTFAARLTYLGLSITGRVHPTVDSVVVYLSGAPLRTINVSHEGRIGKINLTIKRSTLDHSKISLIAEDGSPVLTRDHAPAANISIPQVQDG